MTQSFAVSDAVAIPTAAPGAPNISVPLPSDSTTGAAANAAFPSSASIPADTTIAGTYSSTGDASTPALASSARQTSSRSTREDNNGLKALAFLKLQFSADVTLPQAPAFSFTVPGTFTTANGVTYWLGLYDPVHVAAGWQKSFEGPATLTATTTSNGKPATKFDFASNGKPITFVANQSYFLVLLAIPANTATPTPVPSAIPSNEPREGKPAPVLSTPANIQFPSVTSSPVPLTFTQQGFTGAFTLHGDCTGIVNTSGASPTFTITPVGIGRCVIIGLGDRGASAVVHIGVVTPLETPRPTTAPTTSPSHSPEPSHPPTTGPSTSPSSEPSESPKPSNSPIAEPSHSPAPLPSTQPSTTPAASPSPSGSPTTG